jgi:aspartyl-tRNA(Asn)/glutamyl-tRNA(Gln) amidotransferase subunit B
LTDEEIAKMQENMPILPPEFREKFAKLDVDDSVIAVLLRDAKIANLIAEIIDNSEVSFAKNIVNLFVSTLPAEDDCEDARDEAKTLPSAANLMKLAEMFAKKEISSTAEKEIFAEMFISGGDPEMIAKSRNLLQVSDESAIAKIVDEVLSSRDCEKAVSDFQNGEEKVIGFLVGAVMKASKGSANPALAQKLIREKLSK